MDYHLYTSTLDYKTVLNRVKQSGLPVIQDYISRGRVSLLIKGFLCFSTG